MQKLMRLVEAMEASGKDGASDRQWFVRAVHRYRQSASRGSTLDEELGLAPLPYQTAWWDVEADTTREKLLTELWRRQDGSPNRRAVEIEMAARLYEQRHHPIDRKSSIMPAKYAGTASEIFWKLHRCGANWPVKALQIKRICLSPKSVAMINVRHAG